MGPLVTSEWLPAFLKWMYPNTEKQLFQQIFLASFPSFTLEILEILQWNVAIIPKIINFKLQTKADWCHKHLFTFFIPTAMTFDACLQTVPANRVVQVYLCTTHFHLLPWEQILICVSVLTQQGFTSWSCDIVGLRGQDQWFLTIITLKRKCIGKMTY